MKQKSNSFKVQKILSSTTLDQLIGSKKVFIIFSYHLFKVNFGVIRNGKMISFVSYKNFDYLVNNK